MSDFDKEVERLESQLCDDLRARSELNTEKQTRHLYRRFQHASLTGNPGCLGALDQAIDATIASQRRSPDLWLLKTYIALALHRFREAETFLSADAAIAQSAQGYLVRADLDLQQGRYVEARACIERALTLNPTWDALARAANLAGIMGDIAAADQLYEAAEDELTVKEIRSFAWVAVQRGVLQFQSGRHAQAMLHYRRAATAYSGYWLIEERIAEVLGAQGMFEQAIASYVRIYAKHPKPEWEHAIGDLYSLSNQPYLAEPWKRNALSNYLQSADRGEPIYYQHLADLCGELGGHAPEAIKWARKDVALRANPTTMGNLAWALYRNSAWREALTWTERALKPGVVSARLYFQAASIYAAAGMQEPAARYMQLCLKTNPAPPRARISGTQQCQSSHKGSAAIAG